MSFSVVSSLCCYRQWNSDYKRNSLVHTLLHVLTACLWETFLEIGLLVQRVNANVILKDTDKFPSYEGITNLMGN